MDQHLLLLVTNLTQGVFALWDINDSTQSPSLSNLHKIENKVIKSPVSITPLQQLSAFCQNKNLKAILSLTPLNFFYIYSVYGHTSVQYVKLQRSKVCARTHLRLLPRSPSAPFLFLPWCQCQFTEQTSAQCTCWPMLPPAQGLCTSFLCFHLSSASTFLGNPFLPSSPGRASWM